MKSHPLLAVCCLLVTCSVARAAKAPNTLSEQELNDGWILLFDGETTFGWKPNSEANWKVAEGAISVDAGQRGLLNTTTQFGDYVLKVDFRAAAGTNSGIFLRTPLKPTNPAVDCYELNIADEMVSPFATGSFVGREKASRVKPSDDWRTLIVKAEGGHFTVSLDGRRVLDYLDPRPLGRGHIGLQFNHGRVEFRNVKLKPLGLVSIFNGRDLTGWKVFPDRKSEYTVTPEGELNVKNGNGQIEFQQPVADFVLQLEIFSAGKHLNSGIFFRNIPGEFWQGYESQIQNGYEGGDRTRPIDYGTGAFYRRQKARKVVSNDFEWFHKTLIADGPHMATWVEGYQVTDWTDTRKPHDNPRNGLRLAPGTITIQGHDPTTDLSFRKLRLGATPPR